LIEGAAELDLERHADRVERGLVRINGAVAFAQGQLAAAQRTASVGKGKAFAHLAALPALPLHGGIGAADVEAVVLV
jgi:hypothetical protein